MSDPLDKATGVAPPIIGEGCTQRYDPARMGPELGTDFPDAESLWRDIYGSNMQQNPDGERKDRDQ